MLFKFLTVLQERKKHGIITLVMSRSILFYSHAPFYNSIENYNEISESNLYFNLFKSYFKLNFKVPL